MLFLASVLATAGCNRTPRIDAPPPATSSDVHDVPDLPTSTLNVPITIDLSPVIADLEKAVPRTFGDLEQRLEVTSNSRLHVAFEVERGPFTASLNGATARVSATIRYRGRAWYNPPIAPEISASCGTDEDTDNRPRARVTMASPLSLTSDWNLRSRAYVERVRPASDEPRDECRVTAFSIDITGKVMEAARDLLQKNTRVIDHAIAGIDLRAKFEEWWNTIRTPIEITDSVWLVIDPIGAHHGNVAGRGRTLSGFVSVTARPRIVVGSRPVLPDVPLPPVQVADVDDDLHILVAGVIDYDVASLLLTRQLQGRTIRSGDREVTIQQIRLSGIGAGRLALELDFTGSARGRVFLVGTPRFEPATGEVLVPDLDFDVASSSLLVSGVAWLGHGQITEYLRERTRLPVADAIARAADLLHDGLNRKLSDDVRLAGEVISVTPLGVYPTRDAILLHAHALATARLTVGTDSVPAAAEKPASIH